MSTKLAGALASLLIALLCLSAASPKVAAATTCPTTLSFGATLGVFARQDDRSRRRSAPPSTAGDAVFVHAVGAAGSGLEVDLDVRDPSGAVVCSATAGRERRGGVPGEGRPGSTQ